MPKKNKPADQRNPCPSCGDRYVDLWMTVHSDGKFYGLRPEGRLCHCVVQIICDLRKRIEALESANK